MIVDSNSVIKMRSMIKKQGKFARLFLSFGKHFSLHHQAKNNYKISYK